MKNPFVIRNLLLAVAAALDAASAAAMDATLSPGGVVRLATGNREYRIEPLMLLKDWTAAKTLGGHEVAPTGTVEMAMAADGRPVMDAAITLRQLDGGAAELDCRYSAREDVSLQSLGFVSKLDAAEANGHAWRIGDTRGVFAHTAADGVHLAEGAATSFAFDLGAAGETLLVFPSPSPATTADCLVQDNRNWSDEYHVRLGVLAPRSLLKGETISFSFNISLDSGESLAVKTARPFVIAAGEDWIPLDNRRDIVAGSALDFSPMGFTDAPAGKLGWLRNSGGHFEFEALPGKPQRFCGANLCLTANYPDHATADALATRLRRLGYNAVRIHHHDGAWAASRDCLDYLLAKCFENGIYATTDLYVSRPVAWRDIGVDQDGEVDIHVFKMLCALYEPAFENWAKFAEDFLLHENPYTGRRYIDEPGMPLISLVNEGGFFVGWNSGGRDDPRVAAAWREWMIARRAADPAFAPDLTPDETPRVFWWLDVHPAIAQWTGELEAKMVARMKAHLRSLGCRALLTNDNCGPHYAALQRATTDLDYIDDHFYIDHPRFPETPWKLPSTCQNTNPLLGSEPLRPSEQAFTRMLGKPFTISEWNFAAPSRFRGMGGLLAGAMAALQDWDGLWRFDYSYLDSELGDRGTRGPHYFDLATDPIGQAAERAVLCLFMRGDLAPLTNGVALWDTLESAILSDKTLWGYPPWCDEAWQLRVGSCLSPDGAGGLRWIRREEAEADFANHSRRARQQADDSKIAIDRERGAFCVVTPRTCGGFAESGRIDAGALSFTVLPSIDESKPVPTTLWASSLDGEPLERSSRILLTHLTDVQGEGAKFADDTMTTLLALGGRPLVRRGTARVELRLAPSGDWRAFALDTAGRRMSEIQTSCDSASGNLVFIADTVGDKDSATLLYEIVRTSP